MRHHNRNRKFGRTSNQRRALLRSLAVSLIEREKITTTEAKAKELRPFIERLISIGRRGGFIARRIVAARLGNASISGKLISEIAPRYSARPGGYTRISKLPPRVSDSSAMAVIEFV